MSNANVTHLHSAEQRTRIARASFVEDALRSQRWSTRAAAMRLGMSHTALGDRLKGKVAFLADDIEALANVLERDPGAFFLDYIRASDAPTAPSTSSAEDDGTTGR